MQIKNITAKDPAQNAVMLRDYTYAPSGNITQKATEHGIYGYEYDELHRLTGAVNPTQADEAYTYDKLGNRLTSAKTTGNWTYNANNELQGYDDVSFEYDANGNTTRKVVGSDDQRFIYDVEDRLIRVEDDSSNVIASYYYDPFGRRLWKDVDGTKTYYLYSDEGLVGEYDATGQEIKTYGWSPDSTWGTNPLFVKTGGSYYWYQNDAQGTPQKITATNGSVVWAATYDSFGNAQIEIETIVNNLRMPGQYFDAETGLYYNYNRYYDPQIGRYLRTDPFGQGLNLYAYVFANPVNFMDPMGLCALNEGWSELGNFLSQFALGPLADLWGEYAAQTRLILEDMVYANGDLWWLAATVQTCIDVGGGFVDILRFGEGFAEGGWGYGKDVLRGVGIATMAYGSMSRVAAAAKVPKSGPITDPSRLLPAPKGPNPWQGNITSTVTKRSIAVERYAGNPRSAWVQPQGAGGTPSTLSLHPSNPATKISRSIIPSGTRIQIGRAAEVPEWGGKGGAIQIEILDKNVWQSEMIWEVTAR